MPPWSKSAYIALILLPPSPMLGSWYRAFGSGSRNSRQKVTKTTCKKEEERQILKKGGVKLTLQGRMRGTDLMPSTAVPHLNRSKIPRPLVLLKRSSPHPPAGPRINSQPCSTPRRKTCRKPWGIFFQGHLHVVRQNQPMKLLRLPWRVFVHRRPCRRPKSSKLLRPVLPCAHAFRVFCRLRHKSGAASVGAGPYTPARSIGCKRAIRAFSAGRQNKLASTLLCISCWMSAAA